MYNGNVGGVGGNDNIKWNKQLAKELDAADGKQDGKISASVWNGFIQKTGSKGNSIKNFINLENAAKSFEYYDSKKDAGKIDWKNKWQGMLFEYQKDLGIIVHNEPSAKETTETKTENEVSQIEQKPQVEEEINLPESETVSDVKKLESRKIPQKEKIQNIINTSPLTKNTMPTEDELLKLGYQKVGEDMGYVNYENPETGEKVSLQPIKHAHIYGTADCVYTKDGISIGRTYSHLDGSVMSDGGYVFIKNEKGENNHIGTFAKNPKTGQFEVKLNSESQSKIEAKTEPQSQITNKQNKVTYFKDNKGNTVMQVDYQNNDGEYFDEEEVCGPDGNIISYSKATYTDDKIIRYVKKYEYNKKGDLVKVTETEINTVTGKKTTKKLKVKDEPIAIGHVHKGIPVDGEWGDPELKKIIRDLGGTFIGQQ